MEIMDKRELQAVAEAVVNEDADGGLSARLRDFSNRYAARLRVGADCPHRHCADGSLKCPDCGHRPTDLDIIRLAIKIAERQGW